MNHDEAYARLPSRYLMQPPDEVWGQYDTTEDSWLATYHYPSATRLSVSGGGTFWVYPTVLPDAIADLGAVGIAAEDTPFALFGGLVIEKLEGHRDNEDVIAYAWQKIVQAYKEAVAQDYGAIIAHAQDPKPQFPIMALDARTFRLLPSKELFPLALEVVKESYVNGTSLADAIRYIRDNIATDGAVKNHLSSVADDHEANEVLAHDALATDSNGLRAYASAQGLAGGAAEARTDLLRSAGAQIGRTRIPTRNLIPAKPKPATTTTTTLAIGQHLAMRPAPSNPPLHALGGTGQFAPPTLTPSQMVQVTPAKADDLPGGMIELPGIGRVSTAAVGLTVAGAVAGAVMIPASRLAGAALGAAGGAVVAALGAAVFKKVEGQ